MHNRGATIKIFLLLSYTIFPIELRVKLGGQFIEVLLDPFRHGVTMVSNAFSTIIVWKFKHSAADIYCTGPLENIIFYLGFFSPQKEHDRVP